MTSHGAQDSHNSASSFVGRGRELAELRTALDETSVRGHFYLISGEPGIGKTRLADELAAEARSRGFRVVWGRCWEDGGTPAYWPFIQIVRGCLGSGEPLRRLPTSESEIAPPVVDEVAQIVPELRPTRGHGPRRSQLDPETARFRLFDALANLLKQFARAAPMVIVVDDLHQADLASLRMLSFVAHELHDASIVILGTYRDAELRRSAERLKLVEETLREGNSIPLAGLDKCEVSRMLESRIGHAANENLAAKIHWLTSGNPLFIDGVARVLAAESETTQVKDLAGIRLPDNVTTTIAHRLAMLPEGVRGQLAAAAVIGQEFELALLARITEMNTDVLAGGIDEGSEVGIVVSAGRDRCRFTHPLIREALYRSQKDAARIAVHRATGDAIEHLHSRNLIPHLSVLAHHFREAGNADKAIAYSIRAGKAAFEAFAFEEAFSHLQGALELIDRHGGPPATRAEVLHILSEEAVSGSKCIVFLEAAARTDETVGDKESWAWAQGQLGFILCSPAYAAQNVARGLRHLRAAEPILSKGPPRANQCRFFLQLAAALTWALEVEAGLKAATRAMEIAEQLQDGERDYGLSFSASVLGRLLTIKGQLAEGFGWLEKGWEIADRINNTMAASTAAWNAANMYWGIGDPVEAEKWCTRELASARTSRSPARRLVLINRLINSKATRGALNEALELVPQTLKGEGSFASATSSRLINFFKGAWDESDDQITRFIQRLRNAGDLNSETNALFWGARVKRTMGDLGSAQGIIERCVSMCCERSNVREMQIRPEAVLLSTQMNRLDEASCHLDRCREIMVDGEDWRGLAGGVARAHAVLAAETGRFDESEQGFKHAVAIFRRYQVPFEEAETFWFWGRALKAAGDRRAKEKFDAAVETYRRHEAGQPWIDRVETERQIGRLPGVETGLRGTRSSGKGVEGPAIFRREGEFWTLGYRGKTFRMKDVKGLAYISFLLAHPGERFHVRELIARVEGVAGQGSAIAAEGSREVPTTHELGDAGDALDPHAQADYRRRLRELAEELAEAERDNDIGRTECIRGEQEFLSSELSAAVGIGGRTRKASAHVERARGIVSKNIRAGLEKIRSEDVALGRYFTASIKTGYYCAYLPDPDRKISWQL